jgi:hypothetical protein
MSLNWLVSASGRSPILCEGERMAVLFRIPGLSKQTDSFAA